MRRNRSFSHRLSVYLIIATLVLFVAVLTFVTYSSFTIINNVNNRNIQNVLDKTVAFVDQVIDKVQSSINNEDWQVSMYSRNKKLIQRIIRQNVDSSPYVTGSTVAFEEWYFPGEEFYAPYVYVAADSDSLLTKQLWNEDRNYTNSEWFMEPIASGEPYWSDIYFDNEGAKEWMATYSLPVKDSSGHVFAVITADITLSWMEEMLARMLPVENALAILVSTSGYVVCREKDVEEYLEGVRLGERGYVFTGHGTNKGFSCYSTLGNGWTLVLHSTFKDVFRPAVNSLVIALVVMFVAAILLSVLFKILIERLTRPVRQFADAALSIGGGNFHTVIPEVSSEDEFLHLRNCFIKMQDSINEYTEEIKSTTAKNERFESELNIASSIQRNILSTFFIDSAAVSLHASINPAREVGGDLYDFIRKENNLYFLVGDVSGKGVPAALYMAIVISAFRFVYGMEMGMSDAMRKVNDLLSDNNRMNMFVSVFSARLDLTTGLLSYCNGGHNRILVIRPDGTPYLLDAVPNIVLGIMKNMEFEAQETYVEKGSRLVLYTDGVTEAERSDFEQYGEERLLKWAAQIGTAGSAEEAEASLIASVRDFTEGALQNDDITVMVINY